MNVHVIIPVRDNIHLTRALTRQLQMEGGWDRCWILDNGSKDGTQRFLEKLADRDPRFRRLYRPHDNIHQLWDEGFRHARGDGADAVVFLNNDIELAPSTLIHLAHPIAEWERVGISYPDYDRNWGDGTAETLTYSWTSGTYRHGGMSGYCFMARVAAIDWVPALPLIDPGFAFWYGDDDLAFELEKRGWRQVRVVGLPIAHLGSATAALHPEVWKSVGEDEIRCAEKWGR